MADNLPKINVRSHSGFKTERVLGAVPEDRGLAMPSKRQLDIAKAAAEAAARAARDAEQAAAAARTGCWAQTRGRKLSTEARHRAPSRGGRSKQRRRRR